MDAVRPVGYSNCGDFFVVSNKKVKRPLTRTAAIKFTDKWFSLYIREKGHYVCFTCGKTASRDDAIMSCGHLFSRVSFSTRWDEANAECQCTGCNMFHEHNPHRFTVAYITKYGVQKYELLNIKHTKPFKITTSEIILLGEHYKKLYEVLKNGRQVG